MKVAIVTLLATLMVGAALAEPIPFSEAAIQSGITPITSVGPTEHVFGPSYDVALLSFFPWAPLNARIKGIAYPPIKVMQDGDHITFSAPPGTVGEAGIIITGAIPRRDAGVAVWVQGFILSFHPPRT